MILILEKSSYSLSCWIIFGAHNLFCKHSYSPWLQTYRVLEDWLNIRNTAPFCISKWKSLEQAIKNGKRVHSLLKEPFTFSYFWHKFLWWKPCEKYYLVHAFFESLWMLLSLVCVCVCLAAKKLQWLQQDFVISTTPHSLILSWLCSENHWCWLEHRLVASCSVGLGIGPKSLMSACCFLLTPFGCPSNVWVWMETGVGENLGAQYLKTECREMVLPLCSLPSWKWGCFRVVDRVRGWSMGTWQVAIMPSI